MILRNFPFTSILSILGLLVGSIIGLWGRVFSGYDFGGPNADPLRLFSGYFSNMFAYGARGVVFAFVFAAIFGLIGVVVDFHRKG